MGLQWLEEAVFALVGDSTLRRLPLSLVVDSKAWRRLLLNLVMDSRGCSCIWWWIPKAVPVPGGGLLLLKRLFQLLAVDFSLCEALFVPGGGLQSLEKAVSISLACGQLIHQLLYCLPPSSITLGGQGHQAQQTSSHLTAAHGDSVKMAFLYCTYSNKAKAKLA